MRVEEKEPQNEQQLETETTVSAAGTVLAWGDNSRGRLGDGTTIDRTVPKPIAISGAVSGLAAGGSHSLALLADGSVRAFGDNRKGQLGIGAVSDSSNVPVQVKSEVQGQFLGGVSAVAAGLNHNLVVLIDGTMLAWGDNTSAQLGSGSGDPIKSTPVKVNRGEISQNQKVLAVSAGLRHNLALLDLPPGAGNTRVVAWGGNDVGQTGDSSNLKITSVPRKVVTDEATAVAAGFFHSLALQANGLVLAWGGNSIGQLGDGTTTDRNSPEQVEQLGGVTMVAANGFHSLALMSNGRVCAWGDNCCGQLGDGTTINRSSPVPVQDLGGEVTAVAAGMDFSLALLSDRTVLAWGCNTDGQLGDGTTNRRLTPVLVEDPDTAQQFLKGIDLVTAGSTHVLALK